MTDNIIKGPWVPPRPNPRLSADQRRRQDERNSKASAVQDEISQWQRIPEIDRLKIAQNLGDQIVELGRELGIGEQEALKHVWEKYNRPDRWAKRLRYVRMPSDEGKKSDELAGTFADYQGLADVVAASRPPGALNLDDHKAEARLKLLSGTSRDPDPHRGAKIDFDAARAIGSLAEAFVRQVEEAVPGLKEYFERLAKYQLFHRRWSEQIYRDRFWATMSEREKNSFQNWRGDDWECPYDVDTSTFVADFTGDTPVGSGPANTVPPSYLYDGFDLGGDGNNFGVVGMLPRITLGEIGSYGVAMLSTNVQQEFTEKLGDECDPYGFVRLIQGDQTRIYLILVPVLVNGRLVISLGCTGEEWPFSVFKVEDGIGRLYVPPTKLYYDNKEIPRSLNETGTGWSELGWGPVQLAQPDTEDIWGSIDLIPGRKANTTLALQGTPGADQAAADSILNNNYTIEDLTPEVLNQHFLEVSPKIKLGDGFTPYNANSLAAALFSNLIYVKGEESVLSMMIADARSRVETLDRQFQVWMQDFQTAKSDFVVGTSQKQTSEGA
jgi:hypothetical protein